MAFQNYTLDFFDHKQWKQNTHANVRRMQLKVTVIHTFYACFAVLHHIAHKHLKWKRKYTIHLIYKY